MGYFREGDYNVICARTGFKVKRSECRMEWDGKLVRKQSWLPRHPQDLPAKHPKPSVPRDIRPPSPDVFVYPEGILLDQSGEPVLDSNGQWILTGG